MAVRLTFASIWKIAALTALIAPLVPIQMAAVRFGWGFAGPLACTVMRIGLRILRVHVTVEGAPDRDRPLLLVSNHVSWLDIPVIGALMPLSFVAKREVSTWPIFGLLAKLKRCVFIDRDRRHLTGAANSAIAERLIAGDAIVLFPEGTTSDGLRVLPFRSALLGAAKAAFGRSETPVRVQPFGIAYRRRDGLPIGRVAMSEIAWTGDEDLLPHLIGILNGGPIDVALRFGPARPFTAETDRKALAGDLEREVRRLTKAADVSVA